MVDSDSDQESTPVRKKPQGFVSNYSDEETSLCCIDEHASLYQHSVQLYTPQPYHELPGSRVETYDVVSIPSEQDREFYEEARPSSRRRRSPITDTSETDTSSSSDSELVGQRRRNTGPIVAGSCLLSDGSGYCGDIDTEFEGSRVDLHRKPVDDCDHQYSCRTITSTVPHKKFCSNISRWQHHGPIDLPVIAVPQCGVKIRNCQLHCRGLDNDFYEKNATLTAVVEFSPNSVACSISNACYVELSVEVYEGRVDASRAEGVEPLGTAKERKELTRQEKEQHVMHITVHKVVKLDDIIYNQTCPNVVTFQIKASIQIVRMSEDLEYTG